MKLLFILPLFWRLLDHGVSGVGTDGESVSMTEGNSVTLNTGVKTNQQEKIRWYFKDTRIAQITGDQGNICTDVQCNKGTERFRGRLKLDHQTGSLTITNTRTTDSGVYQLKISGRNNSNNGKTFSVTFHGVSGVGKNGVPVFVMEGDSVTLHTGVETNQQDRIRWYFGDTRIAQISGDLRKICTDVQCKDGDERFRDRLKLDNQTGSLTITNITNTDSGEYSLRIRRNNSKNDKSLNFAVNGVFAAERDEMKRKSVKEGESVTLDPCEVKNPDDLMTWHFNDIPICKERFRDGLKVDHQTGSLTIMNIRIKDSGLYQLQISSSRFSIIRSFSVTVSGVTVIDPDQPSVDAAVTNAAVKAAVGSAIVLLVVLLVIIYICHRKCKPTTENEAVVTLNVQQIPMETSVNHTPASAPLLATNNNQAPSVANGTP